MKVNEIIQMIKAKHRGVWDGKMINEATSRDQILYGDPNVECKGIVTTCFASADVIRKAHALGANLIICHESLFWNHGDHTDWLKDNKTFQAKKQLLDATEIVVWRNHDYIHSGIEVDGTWTDGIFYGVMQEMGWEKYLACSIENPKYFEFKDATVASIANEIMEKMGLKSLRIVGNTTGKIRNLLFVSHLISRIDNQVLSQMDEQDIDAIITMEMVDFTVNEYVRDSTMLSNPKTIFAVGHFNTEEPGMKYFAKYLPNMIGNDYQIHYVQSGDVFTHMFK